MTLTFRWAAWQPRPELLFLLNHSVSSFRRHFSDRARYVVFTDDPATVERFRLCDFEIRSTVTAGRSRFDDPLATWRKWAPAARLDQSTTEIYVDSDVFLLRSPDALDDFCIGRSRANFLTAMEEFRADWPYGNFAKLLPPDFQPINAGLIGQFAGSSLAPALGAAYDWWAENVSRDEVKYHDEQGAVALALAPEIAAGKVQLLNPAEYRVVCPLNNPPVQSLDGLVTLHATYPNHPAFWRFLPEIAGASGLPTTPFL